LRDRGADDDFFIVHGGSQVTAVGLGDYQEDAVLPLHVAIAQARRPPVFDASDLHPDEIVGVIDDAHLVGFGVADAQAGLDGGHKPVIIAENEWAHCGIAVPRLAFKYCDDCEIHVGTLPASGKRMGLTYHDVRRLFEARRRGHAFREVLSFAHQKLFLHPPELEALRRSYREFTGARVLPLANYGFGEYADRFFAEFLGVEKVETLDYSNYEGASLVHDMNRPVDEGLHQRFDTVIEAGSPEHVFQFPTAVRNLMMMTRPGGRIFMTTVANNLCGHGFYQFSPELIYRIFSPENGFERPTVVLLEGTFPWIEMTPARAIYEVRDPVE